MPTRELAAYVAGLPVIRAEEAIRGVQIAGVGTGAFKESSRVELMKGWTSALPRQKAARTPEQVRLALAASGIRFTRTVAD